MPDAPGPFQLMTGEPRSLPALLRVQTYEVTVTDGKVYVTAPPAAGGPP